MPTDAFEAVQERLTELEIKLSFTEDTVDRLNDVVVQQQGTIDTLLREVRRLAGQAANAEPAAARSLREELPPHY
ncbi:Protein SlyX homolog [Rubrivivax sp. A210]|uniref:SlyX family protein n=1 Tax=Rubrivivax sp. A210 TaxID=2772301 RepID=UPI001917E1ED|nr:SlyX family protein [Rubrivivax sp. A210]CAD5374782.1 Protein SlyX homolog [Rubrivivax sp. A210]